MSQAEIPEYDAATQGLDQDLDRRAPVIIERIKRGYSNAARHQALARQLSSNPADEVLGYVINGSGTAAATAKQVARCVIYVRVSTEEQARVGGEAQGYSIPYQRDACIALARNRAWEIVEVYVDAGESARSVNRPQLQKMLHEVKAKRIDYVIVHKIDRWSRNRDDGVEINRAIAANGAKLVSVTEPIDDSPHGRLLYNVMADVAQYHSDNLAVEVLKGLESKARSGGTPYLTPIGYLNHKEIVDQQIIRSVVVDPDRSHLVRWALLEYSSGDWGLRTMRNELERRGLRTRPIRKSPPNRCH